MNARFLPMIPVAAILADNRLTLNALRVLLALHQFTDKDGECYPTRAALAQMCKLPERKINDATAKLVALGWLKKDGTGGRGKAALYTITPHETLPETVRVSPETLPETGTLTAPKTLPVSDQKPCPFQAGALELNLKVQSTSLEHTKNIPETRARARTKSDIPPCPHDVPADLYAEWLDYRRKQSKSKGVVWSARAEALMRRGAKRAGITLAAAMEYTMARTWIGFYPETYLRDEKQQQGGGRQFKTAHEIDAENNAAWLYEATGGIMGRPKQTAEIINLPPKRREQFQLLENTQ